MLRFLKTTIALSVLLFLSGCAIGVTHQYQNANLPIKASADAKLSIGVQDRRLYVVSKKKTENFAGISRGGYGNPFDVKTNSGKPLATDFSESIQTSLAVNGVKVNAVILPLGIDEAEAIKRVIASGDKAILIELNEWKADTYMSTTLEYDVQVLVIDASGKILATKRISGSDNLGGSAINPPEHSRTVIPIAFQKKLEELFAAPEIADQI